MELEAAVAVLLQLLEALLRECGELGMEVTVGPGAAIGVLRLGIALQGLEGHAEPDPPVLGEAGDRDATAAAARPLVMQHHGDADDGIARGRVPELAVGLAALRYAFVSCSATTTSGEA